MQPRTHGRYYALCTCCKGVHSSAACSRTVGADAPSGTEGRVRGSHPSSDSGSRNAGQTDKTLCLPRSLFSPVVSLVQTFLQFCKLQTECKQKCPLLSKSLNAFSDKVLSASLDQCSNKRFSLSFNPRLNECLVLQMFC